MTQLPQVRRTVFGGEKIGMGFNSESGSALPSPFEGFTLQAGAPGGAGQQVIPTVTVVTTHEELQNALGMSFTANGRYGFFKESPKGMFAQRTRYNALSSFLVARVVVKNPIEHGKDFRLSKEATDLLHPTRLPEFRQKFGDSFVRGLQGGGELCAVVRITSMSVATQASLAATLQAELDGQQGPGSFDAAFLQANTASDTSAESAAVMFRHTSLGPETWSPESVDEVIQHFREFPEFARSRPTAYETEVATYDTVPLPIPVPDESAAFVAALADARAKKLRYIQLKNDLEFARDKPAFYDAVPDANTVTGSINLYDQLIDAVTEYAVKLTTKEIAVPNPFNPALLTPPLAEPAPVTLARKTFSSTPDFSHVRLHRIIHDLQPFRSGERPM
ncbi:hypothetical protein [Nonomuraea sp. NPDC023979]|uniref:hypothetical protein n=1 Tax=Nonomuraea sp. NPDC023979 TaxID=3154796 RepID=UPI003401D6E8